MRTDYLLMNNWIEQNSRVLDLGCGDGALLHFLKQQKNINGYGLEIDHENITRCISSGVNVIEQNVDDGLENFQTNSYDTLIMSQTLQAVHSPHHVLDEMLRVGKECIVTFPNFGHWRCRAYISLLGRMPMSETLPHSWFNTPNIHMCTFNDFEDLCKVKGIKILNRSVMNTNHQVKTYMKLWPNLLGEVAIYRITK